MCIPAYSTEAPGRTCQHSGMPCSVSAILLVQPFDAERARDNARGLVADGCDLAAALAAALAEAAWLRSTVPAPLSSASQ